MEFEQLAEKMQPKIQMLLNQLRIYKNREDYAQIALIGLWEAHTSYVPGKYDYGAFLYNRMRYKVIDALRKEARYEKNIIPVEETSLSVLVDRSQNDVILMNCIDAMFEYLIDEEKQLLRMMFVEQCANEQIAKYFNISIEGARKRKYRLLRKLRANTYNVAT